MLMLQEPRLAASKSQLIYMNTSHNKQRIKFRLIVSANGFNSKNYNQKISLLNGTSIVLRPLPICDATTASSVTFHHRDFSIRRGQRDLYEISP